MKKNSLSLISFFHSFSLSPLCDSTVDCNDRCAWLCTRSRGLLHRELFVAANRCDFSHLEPWCTSFTSKEIKYGLVSSASGFWLKRSGYLHREPQSQRVETCTPASVRHVPCVSECQPSRGTLLNRKIRLETSGSNKRRRAKTEADETFCFSH